MTIDTANHFLVSVGGQGISVMNAPRLPMSKDEALNLAAWLVAVADPLGDDFQAVLDAVKST